MTTVHEQSQRWVLLRDEQRAAVVAAVLSAVSAGTAVTVADLADTAKMSRPTFYKYFPTLGAAMLHTHRHVLAEMSQFLLANAPDESLPAREQLLTTFDLSFDYTRMHPDVMRFFSFFDFSFRRFGLSPDEHAELDLIIANSGDRTLELFLKGQADGSIDANLPPQATIMALSGSIYGLAQRLLIQDEYSEGDDEHARAAHELLLEGWRLNLQSH